MNYLNGVEVTLHPDELQGDAAYATEITITH